MSTNLNSPQINLKWRVDTLEERLPSASDCAVMPLDYVADIVAASVAYCVDCEAEEDVIDGDLTGHREAGIVRGEFLAELGLLMELLHILTDQILAAGVWRHGGQFGRIVPEEGHQLVIHISDREVLVGHHQRS